MGAYEYHPLESRRHIRILHLLPGSVEDPIRCNLIHRSLDDTTQPPFETLSYTWGVDNVDITIFVDGADFQVRDNLFAALQKFRNPSVPRLLWADAICINQQDIDERSQQVAIMRDIYAQASVTKVWLGKSQPEDYDAVRVIQALVDVEDDKELNDDEKSSKVAQILSNEDAAALWKFLSHPWFRRVWVLQEVAVAKEATMHCGDINFDWRAISTLNECLWHRCPLEQKFYFNIANNLDAFVSLRSERDNPWMSLDALLVTYPAIFESSEPRDKVYALFGLPFRRDNRELPVVDYRLPVKDVYKQATRFCIGSENPFGILQTAKVPGSSWISDFSAVNLDSGDYVPIFSAGGSSMLPIRFGGESEDILILKGHIIDTIESEFQWEGKTYEDVFSNISPDSEDLDKFYAWAQEYVSEPRRETLEERLWSFLISDLLRIDGTPTRAKKGFGNYYLDPRATRAPTEEDEPALKQMQKRYLERLRAAYEEGRIAVTSRGYVLWMPDDSRIGDPVCIFAGYGSPHVLRGQPGGSYELLGPTYIHGIMDGESLATESHEWVDIHIK
ncbi:HET-domain-containing protein [Thozetella sp. PMI_491]|nr:HET-domain-containing protein [Thozetella sp. PMI_491]